LLRPDVLPLDDIGLIRACERHYAKGEALAREDIERLAEKWKPWRSVATWYLWRSLDPTPVAY
jgi:DNA-3-methyladenine glycosylase II